MMQNRLWSGVAALGLGIVAGLNGSSAMANDFIDLYDGNSFYSTNIFTFSANQSSWWVDGVNHQFTDQYFFNFGTSPTQRALELRDLTLLAPIQTTGNRFLAEFATPGADLKFSLDSSLQGFAADSRQSYREETVTITNTGNSAIDFTLFSYIDFDLLDFDAPGQNTYNNDYNNDTTFFANQRLTQTDPSGTRATVDIDQVPTAVQIAEYPFLISQFKTDLRPNLGNVPGPLTNGDGSAAFQFDRSLQAKGSISFRFIKQIQFTSTAESVPEPTLLLSLGVVAGGLMLLRRG